MLNEQQEDVIKGVYEAMQAGSEGEDRMIGLFAEDGVLAEPFSGAVREHQGRDAIRECYRAMMSAPRPPDFRLELDKIESDGASVTADWTCTASVMPAPMKGRDFYVLQDGKIERLEITLLEGRP